MWRFSCSGIQTLSPPLSRTHWECPNSERTQALNLGKICCDRQEESAMRNVLRLRELAKGVRLMRNVLRLRELAKGVRLMRNVLRLRELAKGVRLMRNVLRLRELAKGVRLMRNVSRLRELAKGVRLMRNVLRLRELAKGVRLMRNVLRLRELAKGVGLMRNVLRLRELAKGVRLMRREYEMQIRWIVGSASLELSLAGIESHVGLISRCGDGQMWNFDLLWVSTENPDESSKQNLDHNSKQCYLKSCPDLGEFYVTYLGSLD